MSMPAILPSGQLHPDALKGPFVKHISSSTPATKGEPGVKVSGDAMAERWKAEEKRANEYWREHRDEAIDLTPQSCFRQNDVIFLLNYFDMLHNSPPSIYQILTYNIGATSIFACHLL